MGKRVWMSVDGLTFDTKAELDRHERKADLVLAYQALKVDNPTREDADALIRALRPFASPMRSRKVKA